VRISGRFLIKSAWKPGVDATLLTPSFQQPIVNPDLDLVPPPLYPSDLVSFQCPSLLSSLLPPHIAKLPSIHQSSHLLLFSTLHLMYIDISQSHGFSDSTHRTCLKVIIRPWKIIIRPTYYHTFLLYRTENFSEENKLLDDRRYAMDNIQGNRLLSQCAPYRLFEFMQEPRHLHCYAHTPTHPKQPID
jgi:hypothetical protein